MIIDTHAHYEEGQFDSDRETLLSTLPGQGIELVVNVGSSFSGCCHSLELAKRFERVYAAIGIHPDEVGTLTEEQMEWLYQQSVHPKVVAIGEIGLDYYWKKENREKQQYWFRRQLRLARKAGLPVNIHSREAAEDTWRVMKEEHLEEIGGIIHCYAYSWEMARHFLDAGFYLGIGGVVTFQNAKKLKEVVEKMPLERIVLETDSPYLAPVPYRGKRNCSAYLSYVAEAIACLRQMTAEEVIQQTSENARQVYKRLPRAAV